MKITDTDTPAVLVDLDVAERNVIKFQKYCDSHKILLRPHIKTHKLPRLAQFQIQQGAIGITCQKISEAEAMIAKGGISDILLTYNILGSEKTARLRKLSDKVTLTVVADNATVVRGLGEGFSQAPKPLSVLVECDTGAQRCGVQTPSEAAELARQIHDTPGLVFAGLMTYPPSGQAKEIAAWLGDAKRLIEAAGQEVRVVSSGGSPDMWQAHDMPLATEYRIGTYIYNDRSLVERGVCTQSDCALTVLATVVSVPTKHRAIIDAGSKVLTSDLLGLDGYGSVVDRSDIVVDQLSEEHGRLVSEQPIDLKIGQKIRIIPNHVCVVSNMVDNVVLIRGDQVIGLEPVAARGKVQ
ncbi:MAG: D-TA family PLP-dependent enzyme [Rhodobacteraceae bacterium]|nr:D-TA family PLP-dependent enzyme [Paracoccaceae bacterium]